MTLPDGREIDVTSPVIYVGSQQDADAVAHQIGLRYASEGHPTDPDFTYAEE